MKKVKAAAVAALTLCMVFLSTGCCLDKDEIIDIFDDTIQFLGKYALTKNIKLQGDKENGIDEYTGNYNAEYKNFNGNEFIFGGTTLERDNGNNLTVSYSLEISSGSAELIWIYSGDEYVISDESSENVCQIDLNAGSNYIILKGDKFSGSLELSVYDDEN